MNQNGEFIYQIETRHYDIKRPWARELIIYENEQEAMKQAKEFVDSYGYRQARVIKIQILATFNRTKGE